MDIQEYWKNVPRLFTITVMKERKAGTDKIIETLQRLTDDALRISPLPWKLFIQTDILFMRTKLDFFWFLWYITWLACFAKEKVAFLSGAIGLWEVGEAFRWTAHHSHYHNTFTVSDLHKRYEWIHGTNFPSPTWRPWQNGLDFVRSRKQIFQLQFFKFYRKMPAKRSALL